MIRKSLACAAVLALFAVPALAGWKVAESGKPFTHKPSGYSIQFPAGWKYAKLLFSDESGATRDGPNLQAIWVDFRKHKLAFKALKKDSAVDMLPQDLAQNLVADMAKERNLQDMKMLTDEPAELAGRPAFRIQFEYRTPVDRGSVRYREIVVGTVNEKGLYLVGYRAPVLHYFARDIAPYEESVKSFSIAAQPQAASATTH